MHEHARYTRHATVCWMSGSRSLEASGMAGESRAFSSIRSTRSSPIHCQGYEGRDKKNDAQNKYKFSVHVNVLCGEGGHKRFTIVPKNVRTGANFGLTNLLMTLFLGMQTGSIARHQKQLIRHTDGGGDNVS
eukprot:2222584-Prymnesium_polylepis.1